MKRTKDDQVKNWQKNTIYFILKKGKQRTSIY